MTKLCKKITLIYLLFLSTSVTANETELDDIALLFGSSLETLTSITINVASKKQETIKDAAGIIAVVTADEIQRYGARNLRDVLDRQTHIQVTGSNIFPHGKVTMRGAGLKPVDTLVALLLNGRPIRDASFSNIRHDIYESFPIESIKQIEFIRGPGSVLYGSNALAGVINIVTKDAPDTPSGNVQLTYGSFETKQGSITGGGKVGDFKFFGSLKAADNQGDDFNNIIDATGSRGTYKTGNTGEQLVFNAQYKDFTVNSLISNTTQDHARPEFAFPSGELEDQRFFIDMGYKHRYNADWYSELNLSYHHSKEEMILGASNSAEQFDSDNYLLELSNQGQLTDKLALLFGGTYNLQKGFIKANAFSYNSYSLGFYSQLAYRWTDWLTLTGGLQLNRPENLKTDYSPRIAAVFDLGKGWGAKLLYGQAFQESTPVERFADNSILLGNPMLNPEKVETFDAQLFFERGDMTFAITYFHSYQVNLIMPTGLTVPRNLVNSGEIQYDGVELEGTYDFKNGFSVLGNMSYQTNEMSDGRKDAVYASDWMIKAGISYDSPQRAYQVSLFNSYFAASTLQNDEITTVLYNNEPADGYNLLTANIRVNMGRALNEPTLSTTTLSIYIDNLLDEDIYFPSINRQLVNSTPLHNGLGIYGSVNIDF